MSDRTYWHVPGARSWHANGKAFMEGYIALCGRDDFVNKGSLTPTQITDRIPPSAHLCGSCARIIAARTDIEPVDDDPMAGTVAPI